MERKTKTKDGARLYLTLNAVTYGGMLAAALLGAYWSGAPAIIVGGAALLVSLPVGPIGEWGAATAATSWLWLAPAIWGANTFLVTLAVAIGTRLGRVVFAWGAIFWILFWFATAAVTWAGQLWFCLPTLLPESQAVALALFVGVRAGSWRGDRLKRGASLRQDAALYALALALLVPAAIWEAWIIRTLLGGD